MMYHAYFPLPTLPRYTQISNRYQVSLIMYSLHHQPCPGTHKHPKGIGYHLSCILSTTDPAQVYKTSSTGYQVSVIMCSFHYRPCPGITYHPVGIKYQLSCILSTTDRIPDICLFFSTSTIFSSLFLHTKARKSR